MCACPGRSGSADEAADEPKPPPFVVGAEAGGALGDPPAPPADKFGLAYLERVYPRLRDGWRSFVSDCRLRLPPSDPLNDTSLATGVEFTVAADGRLLAVSVARSSNEERFDAAAQEVVRDAAPFPRPPKELISDDDSVHLIWNFARDGRLAGMATAELEVVRWPAGRAIPKLLDRGDVAGAAKRLAAARESAADGAAAKQLVELGRGVAAAALVEALRGEDKGVQRLALAAVAEAKVREAAPHVLRIASEAVDKGLRIDAIAALGAVGEKKSTQLLTSIIEGNGNGGRESTAAELAAARSLAALGQGKLARAKLVSRLRSEQEEQRLSALAVLARFAVPDAADSLAAMITAAGTSKATRQAACAALGTAATEQNQNLVHKALRKGLDARDAAVRAACARAVATAAASGMRPGRATYWRLVALLKDKDERVRAAALLAAARSDPKRFGKELYAVLRDRSPVVRVALADALGQVPGAAAYTKLAELAKSEDVAVRRKAAAALLGRPEKQARELVAGMIGDTDAAVRLSALQALDSADALGAVLDGTDEGLGAAALARLVAVRGRPDALADVFGRLAAAPRASASRVRIAAAWLQP